MLFWTGKGSDMNIYQLLKRFAHLGGARTKLAALWLMHITGRRYLGVFIDPVLGCNYRCQMCYFSDEETRRKRHGRMTEQQIERVAHALFPRTLKLQIGCGAEPSIDIRGTQQLVELGKQYHVPYIAMTSNGVLLTEPILRQLVSAGLDELTISLHGIHRNTYEHLMGPTAKYDAFLRLLDTLKAVKRDYPKFSVRVNYTMNADNVEELCDFDSLFADVPIDVLQLRPIRQIGASQYANFDLSYVSECLETIVRPLAERCRKRGIVVLFPEQINIEHFEGKVQSSTREQLIPLFTYFNVTPQSYATNDVHFDKEDYDGYCRRQHIGRQMFKSFVVCEDRCTKIGSSLSNSLNYDIR